RAIQGALGRHRAARGRRRSRAHRRRGWPGRRRTQERGRGTSLRHGDRREPTHGELSGNRRDTGAHLRPPLSHSRRPALRRAEAGCRPGGGRGVRIVSLLPRATESLSALGLDAQLVAVTHDCDYPPEAASLPVVTRSTLDLVDRSGEEIDELVALAARDGRSLYEVDTDAINRLDPDLRS